MQLLTQEELLALNEARTKEHVCLVCGRTGLKATGWGYSSSGVRVDLACPHCESKGRLSNQTVWKGVELPLTTVREWFQLAGIEILAEKKLVNGYWDESEETTMRPWWFIKTKRGWVEIGWRKRVCSIDWTDTDIRMIVTEENVTKGMDHVHAWSDTNAIKYLKVLGEHINKDTPGVFCFTRRLDRE